MLLDIDVALFGGPDNAAALRLLEMVAAERHDWRPSMPDALQAEQFVQRVATVLHIPAVAEWARLAVQESAFPADPASDCFRLDASNLADAIEDLALPAVLVVENRLADGEFVCRVAAVLGDDRVAAAVLKQWLRIENGGGNSQMAALVADECRYFRLRARVAALLDSDEGPSSLSSRQAAEIRRAGRAVVHVWSSRSVENYVPFKSWEWHLSGDGRRLGRLEDVRSMPVEQRARTKIRDRLGRIHPLIPQQVTVTEDDFHELGPTVVAELRAVLAMIRGIL